MIECRTEYIKKKVRKTRVKLFIFFSGTYKIRQPAKKGRRIKNGKGTRRENKRILKKKNTKNSIVQFKCVLEAVKVTWKAHKFYK